MAVYLRDAETLPLEYQKLPPPARPVVVELENDRFSPRFATVRVGQRIEVHNKDRGAHNLLANMLFNRPENHLLPAGTRIGLRFKTAEKIPSDVTCAIHPYARGSWLVLDHPYHDLTGKTGRFTITDVPPGEREFRSWHEQCGWVEKSLKVKVEAGKVTDLGDIRVHASKLFPR